MAQKKKTNPTRVLLVEDQDITAKLFESFLISSGRYTVAGILKNALLAPAWCAKGGEYRSHPDGCLYRARRQRH